MTQAVPRPRCSYLLHLLGRAVIRAAGFRVEGIVPDKPKMVVLGAPHTSNWDFILLLAAAFSLHTPINWMAKSTIFWWPLGVVLKQLGGIPVYVDGRSKLVDATTETLRHSETAIVVVPPEGTRKWTDRWRSGFYWIALNSDTPVLCSFLDYEQKVAGIGPLITLSGSIKEDMDRFREFYGPIEAKFPDKKSVIRLREED